MLPNAGENGVEEERGLVEFNLSAESIVTSALLTFDQAVGTLLGWFSTAGLTVGAPFSFDVTTAFNANAGGSLGIRLQALGEPGQTSYTFDNFKVETFVAAAPEPCTMLLLGTGLGCAALRYRRRTTRGTAVGG